MKKCLITGASGFLGREAVARFKKDHRVIGLSQRQHVEGMTSLDIRDSNKFAAFLKDIRPDVVLHLAAYRDPDICEDQPDEARRLNVEPVRVLRDNLSPDARLVLISTDYVFDGERPPYYEDSARNPVNVYGKTKCEAEDLVSSRSHTIVLRVPLLVGGGPTLEQSGFITQILDGLRSKTASVLDDVLLRFPIWTRDVANVLAYLLSGDKEGVYHASGPRGATRYAWTVEAADRLGLSASHISPSREVVARRARRPPNSELATIKIRSEGFDRFTQFPDVVQQVVESYSRKV